MHEQMDHPVRDLPLMTSALQVERGEADRGTCTDKLLDWDGDREIKGVQKNPDI